MLDEYFKEKMGNKEKISKLDKEYYKSLGVLNKEKKEIDNKIVNCKLEELGIKIGDKVIDISSNNEVYLYDLIFRQKPHTIVSKKNPTIEDFEYFAEYRIVRADGSMGKKKPIVSPNLNEIKKISE